MNFATNSIELKYLLILLIDYSHLQLRTNRTLSILHTKKLKLKTAYFADNHYDLYAIEKSSEELFSTLGKAKISTDGLFINADSGFDSRNFRLICEKWGVIPNVAFNYRNGENKDEYLLDNLLYKQRYVIERTNAWMDSFRSLLNRFDYTVSSWKSFNYIAFMIILFKKIKTNKKSR